MAASFRPSDGQAAARTGGGPLRLDAPRSPQFPIVPRTIRVKRLRSSGVRLAVATSRPWSCRPPALAKAFQAAALAEVAADHHAVDVEVREAVLGDRIALGRRDLQDGDRLGLVLRHALAVEQHDRIFDLAGDHAGVGGALEPSALSARFCGTPLPSRSMTP